MRSKCEKGIWCSGSSGEAATGIAREDASGDPFGIARVGVGALVGDSIRGEVTPCRGRGVKGDPRGIHVLVPDLGFDVVDHPVLDQGEIESDSLERDLFPAARAEGDPGKLGIEDLVFHRFPGLSQFEVVRRFEVGAPMLGRRLGGQGPFEREWCTFLLPEHPLLAEPAFGLVRGEGLDPIPLLVVVHAGEGLKVEEVVGLGGVPGMVPRALVGAR